jgi:hypothetical protein
VPHCGIAMTYDQLLEVALQDHMPAGTAALTPQDQNHNFVVNTFIDRLLLRFMMNPAIMLHLRKVKTSEDKKHLQLIFAVVPDEVVPDIERMINIKDTEVIHFPYKNEPYLGFKVPLTGPEFQVDPKTMATRAGANSEVKRHAIPPAHGSLQHRPG